MLQTDRQTDRRTDGRTDGRKDRQTDGRTDGQTDRDRQTDTQTERERGRHAETKDPLGKTLELAMVTPFLKPVRILPHMLTLLLKNKHRRF